MTDQELEETIKEISESLDKSFDSEKPLTKDEKRHRRMLQAKKHLLRSIKGAREKGDRNAEARINVEYSLVTWIGEKHPVLLLFLMPLVRSRYGWTVF
ncbi:hypothetical protein ES703_36703 [subsurface metagenome]